MDKKIGAFVGKFLPPHIGHLSIIDKMAKDCDECVVVISDNPETSKKLCEKSGFPYFDSNQRLNWFKKHYKNNNNIHFAIIDEKKISNSKDFMRDYAKLFWECVPYKVNYKYADESYRELNSYFPECTFVPINRDVINVHGTNIRQEYEKYKDFIMPEAREEIELVNQSKKEIEIDHVDIVTSHICNRHCKYCVDKFINKSKDIIRLDDIDKFLKMIREKTDKNLEVLLLGGEPTILSENLLIQIADLIHKYNFKAIISTNGVLKEKIIKILPYYDWIQVTVNCDKEIDFYRNYSDKINIKISGDALFTIDKLNHFIEYTKDFQRRSVSMYFTEGFKELCEDEDVWKLLDSLDWKRNGSYFYSFYKGVRFKKCVHGETNIIDEPTVPKLYPNGNYNKTWNNEELDDYLKDYKKL